jgi:hypothetical protein
MSFASIHGVNSFSRKIGRALLLACGFIAPRHLEAQQQSTPADSAAHRQRVDVLTAAERARLAQGPGQAKLLGRMNGVSSFDDQGTRSQPSGS